MEDYNFQDFKVQNQHTFTKIYNEFQSSLTQLGLKIIHDKEVVRGLVLDTFMELWKDFDKINNCEHIGNFLHLVMKRKCINEYHRSKRQPITVTFNTTLHDHQLEQRVNNMTVEALFADFLRLHVKKLTDQQYRFLKAHKVDGLSLEEIADEAGVKVGTVSSVISRGMKTLRKAAKQLLIIFLAASSWAYDLEYPAENRQVQKKNALIFQF